MNIGIVTCSAIYKLVRECLTEYVDICRIYPIIPSCCFSVNTDSFQLYINRSLIENDYTILATGICHPKMSTILRQYNGQIIKLEGNNCWEMLIGKDQVTNYARGKYWLLTKPFITNWKDDIVSSFGVNAKNGNILNKNKGTKILFLQFDTDKLDVNRIDDFAHQVSLPYEIQKASISILKSLFDKSLSPIVRKQISRSQHIKNQIKREPMFDTIMGTLKEVIYRLNIHTNEVDYISPQTIEILGYNQAELKDILNNRISTDFYCDSTHKQHTEYRRLFYYSCLTKGLKEPYHKEYMVRHKEGKVLWIKETIYPNYHTSGWIDYFVGRIEDITKQKEAEIDLRKALERETNLHKELQDQIEKRIKYTQALVHELKTPLTSIIAASDVLLNYSENISQKNLAKSISACSTTLNDRVSELLDIIKGEIGILKLNYHQCDSLEMISEVIECIKPQVLKNKQNLICDLPVKSQILWIDECRLKEVLLNLLSNSIKFTPTKGTIIVKARQQNGNFLVEVKDNGRGISDKDKENIFLPFIEVTGKENCSGGLGLGLPISKMLVELHGGKIWVNSKFGEGSVFGFSIPVSKPSKSIVLA